MAAFSTKGLTVWIQKLPGTATALTITNITNTKPAVITVADASTVAVGDVVNVQDTGIVGIDGVNWIVSAVTSTTITLKGSDGTTAGAPSTTGTVTNIEADMLELCVGTLDRQQTPAQAISVGTTCDPTAQIAGEPQAGTLSISGFIDYQKAGFLEFMKAIDDGMPRTLEVHLPTTAVPSGNGKIIFPSVTATGFTETFGVGAAAAFTGEFVLGSKPTYLVT